MVGLWHLNTFYMVFPMVFLWHFYGISMGLLWDGIFNGWLVVEPTPLKNDGLRQLGWLFHSQYDGKVIIHSCSKPLTVTNQHWYKAIFHISPHVQPSNLVPLIPGFSGISGCFCTFIMLGCERWRKNQTRRSQAWSIARWRRKGGGELEESLGLPSDNLT